MTNILAVFLILSLSISAMADDKVITKNEKNSAPEKIHSPQEVKCAANPSEGIGIDPSYIGKQVSKSKSCDEAIKIVQNCAAGSSLDTSIAGFAIKVCDNLAGRLSKVDADLKKREAKTNKRPFRS